MENGKKKSLLRMAAAFAAGAVAAGGVCFALMNGAFGQVTISKSDYEAMSQTYERYAKLDQLYEAVTEAYYKDVDEAALMDGVYKGLVEGLGDPYSSYMTKDEYETWKSMAVGEYSGVGVTFTKDEDGNFLVISVEDGSPADEAGIKADDIILEVDGKEYDDLDIIGNAIRGEGAAA